MTWRERMNESTLMNLIGAAEAALKSRGLKVYVDTDRFGPDDFYECQWCDVHVTTKEEHRFRHKKDCAGVALDEALQAAKKEVG